MRATFFKGYANVFTSYSAITKSTGATKGMNKIKKHNNCINKKT
jgi:hypothetical protein